MEIGENVRVIAGKHRGQIGTIKAYSGEDGFVIDLGGGKLKMFKKESLSPLVSYWHGLNISKPRTLKQQGV